MIAHVTRINDSVSKPDPYTGTVIQVIEINVDTTAEIPVRLPECCNNLGVRHVNIEMRLEVFVSVL
jgi:hypothetical protein